MLSADGLECFAKLLHRTWHNLSLTSYVADINHHQLQLCPSEICVDFKTPHHKIRYLIIL